MNQQAPAPPIWWLIRAAITAAFFLAVGIFETAATPASTLSWLALMALPPFLASAVIRFGLLRQCHGPGPRSSSSSSSASPSRNQAASLPWKTPLAAADLVLIVVYIPALIIRRP